MARYRASLVAPGPVDEVFDYLADFANAAKWDPGIVRARKTTRGPVRVGTAFEIVSAFFGREVPLRYEVTALEPGRLVVFEGEGASVRSVDTLTFAAAPGGGTKLTYDAVLTGKGVLRVFDPALQLAFWWLGRQALAGLARALAKPPRTRRAARGGTAARRRGRRARAA